MFPSGRTESFYLLDLALTYVTAYGGVLLNNPTVCMGMKESALQ